MGRRCFGAFCNLAPWFSMLSPPCCRHAWLQPAGALTVIWYRCRLKRFSTSVFFNAGEFTFDGPLHIRRQLDCHGTTINVRRFCFVIMTIWAMLLVAACFEFCCVPGRVMPEPWIWTTAGPLQQHIAAAHYHQRGPHPPPTHHPPTTHHPPINVQPPPTHHRRWQHHPPLTSHQCHSDSNSHSKGQSTSSAAPAATAIATAGAVTTEMANSNSKNS